MRPIPLVRVNALVPFVTFLEGIGAPVERLLQDAGIVPAIVADPAVVCENVTTTIGRLE